MNIELVKYAVFKNGNVDVNATVAKFRTDVTTWDEERKRGQQGYVDALVAALEGVKGSVPKPAVISAAFATLNKPLSAWNESVSKFEDAIAMNPKIFLSKKGKGGGLSLLSEGAEAEEEDDSEEGEEEESSTYVEEEEEAQPLPSPKKIGTAKKKAFRR